MRHFFIARKRPFRPSDIANLQLWLDADDAATITDAGGGAVSAWNDKSGNGRHFPQATGAARPTTGANTLNGRNVLTFGGDDFLEHGTAATWKFLHDATGSTTFIVFRADGSLLGRLFQNRGGQTTHGFNLSVEPGGSRRIFHQITRGVTGFVVENISANDVITAENWFLASVVSDPSNATAASRSAIRLDDGTAFQNNSLTVAPSSSDPSFNLRVGANEDASSFLTGRIAEIVIYSGLLATEDREAVEAYLSEKWGIALA